MKKSLLFIFISACVLLCAFSFTNVSATVIDSGVCENNIIWELDDGGTLTINGTGQMTNWTYYVTPAPWYSNRSSIKTVIIANGVTSIGSSAFYGCNNLTEISMPSSVTKIGTYAFANCTSIDNIELPDSITIIDSNSFYGCASLMEITIPQNATNIGSAAFKKCSSLKNITLPEGLTSIGSHAFDGCSNLSNFKLPNSLTNIGYDAFTNCTSLTSMKIPQNVKSIESSLFYLCSGLESVSLPETITSIGPSAFLGCSNLTNITIPNSVTSIGRSAFVGCNKLTSISIPNTVTSIGEGAFKNCRNLQEITLPFVGSSRDANGTADAVLGYVFGESITSDSGTTKQYYSTSSYYYIPTSLKKVIITDTTQIPAGAFYNCVSLTSITIPNNVITIDKNAFYNCSSLTDITIPSSVTSIGESAFNYCKNLVNITIPERTISIGTDAFSNCEKLTTVNYNATNCNSTGGFFNKCSSLVNINIGENVKTIPNYAFYKCSTVANITIPNGVTSIGNSAFYGCTGMTSITIPNGVTNIGSNAFNGCKSLKSITIPSSVNSIGTWAFYGCSNLTTVNYNAINCTSIGSSSAPAFMDCTSLTNVNLGGGVESIPDYAFYVCKALTSINIPQSVTNIGRYAFSSCEKLASVTLSEGVVEIAEYAFFCCSSLMNITIPSSVISIGNHTFRGCNSLENIYVDDNNMYYSDINGVLFNKNKDLLIQFALGKTVSTYTIPNCVKKINDWSFYGCKNLIKLRIPNGVTSVGTSAFESCSNLIDVVISNTVVSINQFAFSSCNKLKNVFYQGSKEEWNTISIGEYNTLLTDATKTYDFKPFLVEVFDMNSNKIGEEIYFPNETINLSNIISQNARYNLYRDNQGINKYDITSKITTDLVLYADVFEPNVETITITGKISANLDEPIKETIYFSTNKDVYYLICDMKFPDCLSVNEIIPVDFDIVEDSNPVTANGYTTLSLTCIYRNDASNMPKGETIIPFELVFDIDNYTKNENVSIEILDSTEYCGNENYKFATINNTRIDILPKLAESIEISGANIIDAKTKFEAIILPDYTTNKNVMWSVNDTSIATIEQDGTLNPLNWGTVTITARTIDGSNLSSTKNVTISAKAKINSIVSDLGDWEIPFNKDNSEYIIYVPTDTTSINLTSSFDGGTLEINGSYAFNDRIKTVMIPDDVTKIRMFRAGVTNCNDNEYILTVIKTKPFTKVTVSEDGKSFNVRTYLVEDGDKIILALYEDERFVKMYDDVTVTGKTVPFTVTESYDTVKVMVWENFSTLKPLCEANSNLTVIE